MSFQGLQSQTYALPLIADSDSLRNACDSGEPRLRKLAGVSDPCVEERARERIFAAASADFPRHAFCLLLNRSCPHVHFMLPHSSRIPSLHFRCDWRRWCCRHRHLGHCCSPSSLVFISPFDTRSLLPERLSAFSARASTVESSKFSGFFWWDEKRCLELGFNVSQRSSFWLQLKGKT